MLTFPLSRSYLFVVFYVDPSETIIVYMKMRCSRISIHVYTTDTSICILIPGPKVVVYEKLKFMRS